MQAQVYKIHSDFYYVKNSKHEEFTCKLRDVIKKQKIDVRVGDFVELSSDNNFIVNVINRNNFIDRPKVANIDLAVVMSALHEPELDYIQLNRYLTYLNYYNIKTVICFNKKDLEPNINNKSDEINSIYKKLGYKTFFISAKNKTDMNEIKKYIKNKTIVLCGLSGVGKTTLLNSLNSKIDLRTGSISAKTQKGRHTTRHVEILEFDDFKVIDTPGFSCLKFDFLLPAELINLFDDIKKYANNCKYSNCLHNNQKNGLCSVADNIDKIAKSRYESYICYINEAMEYKEKISKTSIKKEEFKKKVGNRTATKISKRKRDLSRNTTKQKTKDIE